eukprot:COSAG02_NODE_8944_length_2388_cov_15.331149_2_plen_174_part_00
MRSPLSRAQARRTLPPSSSSSLTLYRVQGALGVVPRGARACAHRRGGVRCTAGHAPRARARAAAESIVQYRMSVHRREESIENSSQISPALGSPSHKGAKGVPVIWRHVQRALAESTRGRVEAWCVNLIVFNQSHVHAARTCARARSARERDRALISKSPASRLALALAVLDD